jgi:hypothetical protein
MSQFGEGRVGRNKRRFIGRAATALLLAAALCQTGIAEAAPHGGVGGIHGGGFHGGAFHGGGFGGFHGGALHNGFHHGFRNGGFHGRGFRGFRGGFLGGLGCPYYSYPYEWQYPYGWDYYPSYGYDPGQYETSRNWYYCSDPAGYYPYVTQCTTSWQAVPAS